MKDAQPTTEISLECLLRTEQLFDEQRQAIFRYTDRLLAALLMFEWLAAVFAALWFSPLSWTGTELDTHFHVWTALLLGGVIVAAPVAMAWRRPGRTLTRHLIGVGQMLIGALLIHLSGGRIETHFHVFGSLAFLAFYRDWHVLLSASAVVAADHLVRGIYWPQSVYGVLTSGAWRWLEHAGWVIFEDMILIPSCLRGVREMREIARRQAELETTRKFIADKVKRRTAELEALNKAFGTALVDARRSEEKFRHTLNAAADAIISVDEEGRIVEFNRTAEATFGYNRSEVVGAPIATLIPEHLRGRHTEGVRRVLATGERSLPSWQGLEFPGLTKDGREVPLEISISLLEVGGKRLLTGILRDITQRKAAEEERRHLEMQLAHAQKLESIGQLAAGIAHEINTPIQYVGDNITFLRDAFADLRAIFAKQEQLLGNAKAGRLDAHAIADAERARAGTDIEFLNDEVPRAIQQTLDGVDRVARIVRAMKEFSHPGSESKADVDLNRLIENTITVARNEWKYVADLVTDFDAAVPPVPCIAGEFNQVILNLIVNAAHAIAERNQGNPEQMGVITISTRALPDWAEIRVQDTGTGIPEAIRAKVFDPFFTTKAVGKGTGQGRALAHTAIVKKHGGTLGFETEIGKGTTFLIRLPLPMEFDLHDDCVLAPLPPSEEGLEQTTLLTRHSELTRGPA